MERLQKLAAEKSVDEKRRAENERLWQETHLPMVSTFNDASEMREEFELIRSDFVRDDLNLDGPLEYSIADADDWVFWQRFKQMLQYRSDILYWEFRVKDSIDEFAKDDENLERSPLHLFLDPNGVMFAFPEALQRLLLAMARFAKNIASPNYSSVLELLVQARQFRKKDSQLSAEAAEKYAGSFKHLIELLLCERMLLSESELKEKLVDPGPKEEEYVEEQDATFALLDDWDDPEEATRESIRIVQDLYDKHVRVLLTPTMWRNEDKPPIEILARETKKLADDMERGEPVHEAGDDYPYAMLEDLLKLNTRPIYEKYHLNPNYGKSTTHWNMNWQLKCEGDPVVFRMPHDDAKTAILADLKRFLELGMRIAHRIESTSLGHWQKAYMFLRDVGELICRARPTKRGEIELELHHFFNSIREARAQLWVDLQTRGGKYDFAAENETPAPMPVVIETSSIDEAAQKFGKAVKGKLPSRKNQQLAHNVYHDVAKIWNERRANAHLYAREKGHKISHVDVFTYHKHWMIENNIKTADDLFKAIDNARKKGLIHGE